MAALSLPTPRSGLGPLGLATCGMGIFGTPLILELVRRRRGRQVQQRGKTVVETETVTRGLDLGQGWEMGERGVAATRCTKAASEEHVAVAVEGTSVMARPSSSSSLSDTTRSSSRDSARSSCAATASFSSPQPPSPPSQQQQQQQQQQPPTICYRIRKATPDDIPYLPDVERSAGEVFRSIEGLESLADDDPMPEEVLRCYAEAGWVWVATVAWDDRRNGGKNEEEEENESVQEVVGFLACFPIVSQRRQAQVQPQQLPTPQRPEAEGTESETQAYLHIAELSVHASHQKRGLGGRLLDTMFVEVAEGPVVSCATIAVGGGEEEQGDDEEALSQRQGQACDAEHGGEGARGLGSDEDGGEDEAETEGETLGTQRGWRARRRVKARIRGYSLTTYRHLSFNRPFYERIGFREVSVGDIEGVVGARGRELWEQEQRSIVLRETRCWMVRALS